MAQPAGRPARMLVVDDELGICDFLRAFFSKRGYEVRTACSGEDALREAASFDPNVVLLDVRMPGISGMEVLEKLHAERPACKVIMITAVVDEGAIEQAKQLGAADYITKPFSLHYLEQDVLGKLAGL